MSKTAARKTNRAKTKIANEAAKTLRFLNTPRGSSEFLKASANIASRGQNELGVLDAFL